MQRSKVPNQHVVMIMVLEICLEIAGKITSGNVTEAYTEASILENNITVSERCSNCSSWSHETKSVEENCSNSRGWNLKGSEWGCCGNYAGCCTYASFVCYIHDALCKCCDVGVNFCGPTCKPELDCSSLDLDMLQNDGHYEKTANATKSKDEEKEHLNVETVEHTFNDTENSNSTYRNYFLRGKAISGTGENLFQDGDDTEEGSGEVET
ncbi:uncharacterized protein LOC123540502 [Mercenaria mercenaria]|uniref:uncharacterized protein LOC123540502 n=1 Tax=Mercenaria mercenaria TaxID=6596 RepID=UPI00234FA753|nr:uncharacterized protein LOC123540502 [Mercenaria mercenaria]